MVTGKHEDLSVLFIYNGKHDLCNMYEYFVKLLIKSISVTLQL